jgi:hypothetical protein
MRGAIVAAMLATGAPLLLAGCMSRPLNRDVSSGFETHVPIDDVPVKGFPVVVDRGDEDDVTGELLAVDDGGLWVLGEKGTTRVSKGQIEKVTVKVHSNLGWAFLAWTLVGTASTISHGFVLVLSAPSWAIAGGTVTGIEFGRGKATASSRDAHELYQYARFPAGLPAGWNACLPEKPRM